MSTTQKELMIVCGEASGDLHAAELVRHLRQRNANLRFFGMGGQRLAHESVELLFDAQEVSVMGITEVLPKIPRILKVMGDLTAAAKARRPVCAILVDIPDFNLRLAKKLRKLGIPVVYYISPMVWAWRTGRVKFIQRWVNRMLCILPFEEKFLQDRGVSATYVGNPVVEQVPQAQPAERFRHELGLDTTRPTLALLPGSRLSEIHRLLPVMVATALQLARQHENLQVLVAVAPSISQALIESAFRSSHLKPVLIEGKTAEVVGASDVAIVASGTATLEAGLMQRPLVVVYRMAWLTYWVGRLFLKISHISLVNLLLERRVVPELIQQECTPERIAQEVERLWEGKQRDEVVESLRQLPGILGPTGASDRAALAVLDVLQAKT